MHVLKRERAGSQSNKSREKAARPIGETAAHSGFHFKKKVVKEGRKHPCTCLCTLTPTHTQGVSLCIREREIIFLLGFADPAAVAHLFQRAEEALLGFLVCRGCLLSI